MIVVHQCFVLHFPENLPSDAGAPLLCAGITIYSLMKYYGMTEPGKHLGVAGLGGLGRIAAKIGKAFGLKVTVISTSPKKEDEAIKKLGADAFVFSSDPAKLKAAVNTIDYIIDTIVVVHPLALLLSLLKMDGKLVTLGLHEKPLELPIFPLVLGYVDKEGRLQIPLIVFQTSLIAAISALPICARCCKCLTHSSNDWSVGSLNAFPVHPIVRSNSDQPPLPDIGHITPERRRRGRYPIRKRKT
ncbi:hypothetical protein RDI58_007482 [Solanum bulbocastanum]|uniref:Alcohol dehydrogenase-like C-terminal domain-containing protein n=1 Tax=Solanum bulbocastanum TaxID=147425 RepID=A0AAN8TWI4_SOLBU